MSFPAFPNPARRARILEAQQLRMQALTMRQIAERMHCSVSTVHAYLRDFEFFRADLIHELAADQIVGHLIHLGDPDDPNHDQRRADLHELRLLLSALPQIRRDETDRSVELLQPGVAVDRYGARYTKPERLHPPTAEENEQLQQPAPPPEDPDPDQPLAFLPVPAVKPPPPGEACPAPDAGVSRSDGGGLPQPTDLESTRTEPNTPEQESAQIPAPNGASAERTRTEPNKPEHDPAPTPVQDATSSDPDQNSLPPDIQAELDQVERQLEEHLRYRDWLNDYPQHNPWHPARKRAQSLVKQRDALLAQLANATDPAEAPA